MGIYNSNAYNPMGAIQAALNNVNEQNRIRNEFWKRNGEIWSNFAKEMGSMGGRLVDAYQANKESPEARLAALEQERNEAIYNQQVEQRQRVNDYLMNGEHGTDMFRRPEIPVQVPYQAGLSNYGMENEYRKAMQGYRPNDNGYDAYLNAPRGGVYPEIEDYYRRGI